MRKQGVELVGVYGRRADRSGVDVGEAIGHGTKIGVELTNDLPGMLSSAKPDVVIQATFSRIEQAAVEIKTAVQGKANVISIFQYAISLLRYNSKKGLNYIQISVSCIILRRNNDGTHA
jgi:hypothetical protein